MVESRLSCILLEDEQYIRNNILAKLKKSSESVDVLLTTDNGYEVLDFLKNNDVELVLTDIKMPIISGFDVIKKIKKMGKKSKIVVVSGYGDFDFVQQALRLGVDDYLLKPIKVEDISEIIERHFDSLEDIKSDIHTSLGNYLINYIEKYFYRDINVEKIAVEMGYSPEYINRVFKKENNITIFKAITNLRIEEAKKLLESEPVIDVQIIGKKVGYPDRYHFSKVFKNKTGYYPTEYRQKKKNTHSEIF